MTPQQSKHSLSLTLCRKSHSANRTAYDPFNKSVIVYSDDYLAQHNKEVERERLNAKYFLQIEKDKLRSFLTKQANDRSNRQLKEFMKEKQDDVELMNASMRDFDHRHKLKMDRLHKMLMDSKNYNTHEMLRKYEESTRVFDKDTQALKIKEARRKCAEDNKQHMMVELMRKNRLGEVAKHNLALAQDKIERMRMNKFEGRCWLNVFDLTLVYRKSSRKGLLRKWS